MRSGTIAWFLGTLSLHSLATLPELPWSGLLFSCLLLLALPRPFCLALCFLAGFVWTGWCAETLIAERPPSDLLDRDIEVHGVITDIPKLGQRRTRFEFAPEVLRVDGEQVSVQGLWRLSWYEDAPALVPGQRWRLKVRLKAPRQILSADNFDYQRHLFRNQITAVGYVREDSANLLLGTPSSGQPLNRLRAELANDIRTALGDARHQGVIAALVVGVRYGIPPTTGELMRRTGTAHLMAISGLHVAIAASLGFLFGRGCWRLSGAWRQRYPAPKVAALGALLTATAYAALAGFSLPTQRALVMLVVAVLALLSDRSKTPTQVYFCALLAVLIWDPFSPLDGGFWLSFGAVAALVLGHATLLRPTTAMRTWFRIQCLLAVALLPLMVTYYSVVNLATLPANLIAVPWAALMIVPPALLGGLLELLFTGAGAWPWWIAETAFAALYDYLTWLDRLDLLIPVQLRDTAVLACTVAGALLLLTPRGFPGRWLGLLCIPILLVPANSTAPKDLRITVFDTGRGYATVLQSADRAVVFDAGPSYSANFGFADAVLVPHLKSRGVHHVDALVISRPMPSRVGGSRSLLESYAVERLLVPQASAFPVTGAEACEGVLIGRYTGLTLRAVRTLEGGAGCRLLVTSGDQEIAVLDPDFGPSLGLPGVADLRLPHPSSRNTRQGILTTYEYLLDGRRAVRTESPGEKRIRYWHY